MPLPIFAECYAGKRVLVTGGAGFIGSNLTVALVHHRAQVTVLDTLQAADGGQLFNVEPVRDRVQLSRCDLRDSEQLRDLVARQDLVFSVAGQTSHVRSMREPLIDLEINCQTHLSLLETCRAVNPSVKLVLASTRQVYGRPLRLPVDEQHPTVPVDINGIHKLAAEMYYELYFRVHGVRYVCLRLTNTYGPRMDLRSPDKGVTNVLIHNALVGQPSQLYEGGKLRRDFNYIDDVIDALLRAGASDTVGGVFNLGHPRPRSLKEFADILRALTGSRYECAPLPEDRRAIDIGDYWGDFSKFSTATGWAPSVDLESGLEQTVRFFRQHARHYLSDG